MRFPLAAVAALLACAARAEMAYVPNAGSGTVSVIDTASDTVVHTWPEQGRLGKKPQGSVISRDGKTLLVTDGPTATVIALDAQSGRVLRKIAVGPGPEGIGLAADGGVAAACVEEANAVVLIRMATLTRVASIPVRGHNPEHCIFDGDGRWLFAANEDSDDVDIVDLHLHKSTGLIPTIGHPRGMGILPDGSRLYIANEAANLVQVVHLPDIQTIKTIPVGVRPAGILVAPDGKHVYVSNGGSGTVAVIDPATDAVVATIPVGKRPWNMAITHDGAKLYVANGRSNDVSVINTQTNAVTHTIAVGELPWGVSLR